MPNRNLWQVVGAESVTGKQLVELLNKGDEDLTDDKSLASDGSNAPFTVFLCDDSASESDGRGINPEATLSALEAIAASRPPSAVVYLSSQRVYGMDAGRNINESGRIAPSDKCGSRFARTEALLSEWAERKDVRLIIGRAGHIFGSGVDGEMLRLFNRAIRGHYIHVRGNDAMLSAITSLDAARTLIALANSRAEGVYNISDGNEYTWIKLVEAMTANVGAEKRMTHLPQKWVKWIVRLFGRVPIVAETMSPEALAPISRTLTLDTSHLATEINIKFHNTLDVIARRDKTYPYKD